MSISLGSTSISNAYLGSSAASAIYLGGTQVWSSAPIIGLDTIYLGGLGSLTPSFTQANLEAALSGENISYFVSQSTNIYASSSTDYNINSNGFAFNSNLKAYIDGGRCKNIGSLTGTPGTFRNATNLTTIIAPSASIIGSGAFRYCTNLTTVSLPRATQIGNYAFQTCTGLVTASFPLATEVRSLVFEGCINLQKVEMPIVTTFVNNVFTGCTSLVSASYPQLTSIGQGAFYGCTSLSYIDMPLLTSISNQCFLDTAIVTASFANATTIGGSAFENCVNLVSASFSSATTIGSSAFYLCSSLGRVYLPALSGPNALGGNNQNNGVFAGVAYGGTITLPSLYLTNNDNGPDGDLVSLREAKNWTINYIPSDKIFIGGLASTLTQGQLAAKLTGETITYFNNTLIPNLYVSSSTYYQINDNAFINNSNITSYIDGGKCTVIGGNAFNNCGNLATASFSTATIVGLQAFYGAGGTVGTFKINLPTATTINYQAFAYSAITTIDLPRATYIGEGAFNNSSITEINLSNATLIDQFAFYRCNNLGSQGYIVLPKVTQVYQSAFQECSLGLIDLPLATSIGSNAFATNPNLYQVNLPSLTGPNALGGSPLNNGVFVGAGTGGTITVPIEYQTNNAGGLDGDLAYLQNTLGWQIIWLGGTTTSTTTTTTTAAPTVVIGTQEWMVSDLGVTKYANGDTIPQVTDTMEWATLTTGAWCYYANDPSKEKLYNLYAVNDPRGLAPAGYHLPTLADYNTLHDYLGGNLVAGGPLKETGTTHWQSPNTGATNTSGFTGLGTGYRSNGGDFLGNGTIGAWFGDGGYLTMYYDNTQSFATTIAGGGIERYGFKVRLIKN